MHRPVYSENAVRQPARRAFFKSALLGGGAVVAAAVAAQDARAETSAVKSRSGKAGQGYRETAAVRRYYQLAREV